jgi:uncharacterized protein (DUF1501 family)
VTHAELPEILTLLSQPATGAGHVSRRRFLQGALAAGSLAAVPGWADRLAAAATPVDARDGILVVLHLAGGNDGLNTVVPLADRRYRDLRGPLAVSDARPLDETHGFHPALEQLAARYRDGKVAIVHGVGRSDVSDQSHFSSTAAWMAGTAGTSRTTGWLGRWLDGVPEAEAGLRAITVGPSVPLHLIGERSTVTAVDLDLGLFGADRSAPWMPPVYDTVVGFGSAPTGKGVWADRLAVTAARSIEHAELLDRTLAPRVPDRTLASQLRLAARLINADLGVRVVNVSLATFDTHEEQRGRHHGLLADLDAAVTAFYAELAPAWHRQVALLSFSEFGRTPHVNGSRGTDHGTSSALLVIGEQVRGGMHGTPPRLDRLDDDGHLEVTGDYRDVYATVLERWLAGDATELLGGTYRPLDLFRTPPGG